MLTICTRCRTPYDHRQAGHAAALVLAGTCGTCTSGTLREEAPVLAAVAHLEIELTVLPRSVLPVAS